MAHIFGEVDNTTVWIPGAPRVEEFVRQPIVGYNRTITTAEAYIWPTGGNYVWPTAAQPLSVVSTSASDGVGGLGARAITIYGLGATLTPIHEEVTMNGIVPVITTQSFFRVNTLVASQGGTYSGTNLGLITATQQSSAILMSTIQIDDGFSQQAIFTTPSTHHAFIHGLYLGATATKAAVDFGGVTRGAPLTVTPPVAPHLHLGRWVDVIGSANVEYRSSRYVPPGSDIWMTGQKSGTGNDPGASVEIDLTMVHVRSRQF